MVTQSDSRVSRSFYYLHGIISQPTYRVVEYFKRFGNPTDPNVLDNGKHEYAYRALGPLALTGAALLISPTALVYIGLSIAALEVGRLALHILGYVLQEKDYIHVRTGAPEDPSATPKIMTWNILGFPAGLNYNCGGCIPLRERLAEITATIKSENPDIVILQECIMDASVSEAFIHAFKDEYAHFFIHNGPSPLGIESGLLVMSKSPIAEYSFTPFTTNTWMKRGFVTLKIPAYENRPAFAVIGTHMEAGSDPDDVSNRTKQLAQIHAHAKTLHCTAVLAGDLNIDAKTDTTELDKVLCQVHTELTCTNELNKIRHPNSSPNEEAIDQIGIVKQDSTLLLKLEISKVVRAYHKKDGMIDSRNALSDHHALVAIVSSTRDSF